MSQLSLKDALIMAGESVSKPVQLNGQGIAQIEVPSTWTDAPLTAQTSRDGTHFSDFRDSNGNEIVLPVIAGGSFDVPVAIWGKGFVAIRFRSGTADAPIPQGVNQQIGLTTRDFA